MVEIYADRWIAKNGPEPTLSWEAAIGSLTRSQIEAVGAACVARCRRGNDWPPDLAEFLKLAGDVGINSFGLTTTDVMAEFWNWRKESYRYESSERYPWRHPVLYQICTEMRRSGTEGRLNDVELETLAARLLVKWEKSVELGFSVPPIRAQIANKAREPFDKDPTGQYRSAGEAFRAKIRGRLSNG
ncbi:replication protein P [Hafnia alvei]|uniref:replication protein P n=1 Tax=Hafnia alvei TaxID=569 RepID=UPI00345EE19D